MITRYLWPLVVIPMVVYPYTKRWTPLCHIVLGLADGLGPVGAWVAVTGKVTWEPFVLGAGVGLWIAGFDIIYAFMDIKVDREQGLHSIPADFGHGVALWTTRGFHLLAVVLLAITGWAQGAGSAAGRISFVYYMGVAVCAALLFYENWLMRKADLEKVGVAFMTMNGIISVVFLFFTTLASSWDEREAAMSRLDASRFDATPEPQRVRTMFDRISGSYDRLNDLMTAGLHHRWRELAVMVAQVGPAARHLTSAAAPATWLSRCAAPSAPRGGSWGSTSPRTCSMWPGTSAAATRCMWSSCRGMFWRCRSRTG